jgi:uncharacterized protein (DUF1697 family)
MKYLALLRGINVGGNNKISMQDLKNVFQNAGFSDVQTYINSGNVVFNSEITDENTVRNICESNIYENLKLKISVNVISSTYFLKYMQNVPQWWNADKNSKHNAIFVMPPFTAEDIANEVGAIKPEYEQIAVSGNIIFWSAPIKTFSRTRWSKIVSTKIYRYITIRNSSTTLKLLEMLEK